MGAPRVIVAAVLLAAILGATPVPHLASTNALMKRLGSAGRGEAHMTQTIMAESETVRADRGRIALEPPDRLRIDFEDSGERITMRGDGGEWLQPSLKQLLILRPSQAQAVVATWRAFLDGGASAYHERARGQGRYRLTPARPAESDADSIDVELGPDGLPRRVDLWVADQRWRLVLQGWTFAKAKGSSSFRLRAPAGYATFEWP